MVQQQIGVGIDCGSILLENDLCCLKGAFLRVLERHELHLFRLMREKQENRNRVGESERVACVLCFEIIIILMWLLVAFRFVASARKIIIFPLFQLFRIEGKTTRNFSCMMME